MVQAKRDIQRRRTKPPATRVHPEKRAATEGLNALAAIVHGAPESKGAISYYTPELIQCTLPHSDPKTRDWIRTSGQHTLIISSGVSKTGQEYGIPYGSFPRLVLAYIITHIVEGGSRKIEFKSYFRTFLKEIGYTTSPSVRHLKTLQNGLERILYATITYEREASEDGWGARLRRDYSVGPESLLFWNYKQPDQGGLWDTVIEISEKFYTSILNAPVPLRTDMLSALRKSPLAIDLYMWLSYRLYNLQKEKCESLTLGYGSLQTQFGTSIASGNYRNFRHELRLAFDKVKTRWEQLSAADGKPSTIHCELGETTITLYKGPLLIAATHEKEKVGSTASVHTKAILAARKFDGATMKKARQIAGTWDIETLAQRYFAWLEEKGIVPEAPQAHFFDFVRSHVARNS